MDPFLSIQLGVFHVMLVLCRFFPLDTKKLAKSLYKERIISAVEIASSVSLFLPKKEIPLAVTLKAVRGDSYFGKVFSKRDTRICLQQTTVSCMDGLSLTKESKPGGAFCGK